MGELASFYQYNGVNGPYNFYRNPNTLGANLLENYSASSYNGLVIEAHAPYGERTRLPS